MAGFAGGVLLFAAANILAAHPRFDCGIAGVLSGILGIPFCSDDIRRVGFPFLVWEEGGFIHRSVFNAKALALDIAIALFTSALCGPACRRSRAALPATRAGP